MDKIKQHKKSRLSIDIDPKMHKELKIISINRNCTLKKLVLRAVAELVRKEKEINNTDTSVTEL